MSFDLRLALKHLGLTVVQTRLKFGLKVTEAATETEKQKLKQDNVQANSESVHCRVFQTRKVLDYQCHHFELLCTSLLYIKHTYYIHCGHKNLAVTLACLNRFL